MKVNHTKTGNPFHVIPRVLLLSGRPLFILALLVLPLIHPYGFSVRSCHPFSYLDRFHAPNIYIQRIQSWSREERRVGKSVDQV